MINKRTNYKQYKAMGKDIIDINDRLISIFTNKNYCKLITVEVRDMLKQAINLISKFNSRAENHMLDTVKPPEAADEKWKGVFYPNFKLIDCYVDDYDHIVPVIRKQCPAYKWNTATNAACVTDGSLCLSCYDFIADQDEMHFVVQCMG